MTTRSTVSADISKHTIWINSTDFKSTVKAVKIHEMLISDCGYDDACMLERSNKGEGVSIAACDFETVSQMREDYAWAKKSERELPTTSKHEAEATELLAQFYN